MTAGFLKFIDFEVTGKTSLLLNPILNGVDLVEKSHQGERLRYRLRVRFKQVLSRVST